MVSSRDHERERRHRHTAAAIILLSRARGENGWLVGWLAKTERGSKSGCGAAALGTSATRRRDVSTGSEGLIQTINNQATAADNKSFRARSLFCVSVSRSLGDIASTRGASGDGERRAQERLHQVKRAHIINKTHTHRGWPAACDESERH
jgi:hypothetical protein